MLNLQDITKNLSSMKSFMTSGGINITYLAADQTTEVTDEELPPLVTDEESVAGDVDVDDSDFTEADGMTALESIVRSDRPLSLHSLGCPSEIIIPHVLS